MKQVEIKIFFIKKFGVFFDFFKKYSWVSLWNTFFYSILENIVLWVKFKYRHEIHVKMKLKVCRSFFDDDYFENIFYKIEGPTYVNITGTSQNFVDMTRER